MTARKNAKNTRGRPFKPGNAGRPKGSRNKATVAAEALLDGETGELTRKAIDLALEGDTTALRLCLERILPPRKSRPVTIDLPQLQSSADVLTAMLFVTNAVGAGELTPEEGQALAELLDKTRRAQELIDFEERLKKLEANQNKPVVS